MKSIIKILATLALLLSMNYSMRIHTGDITYDEKNQSIESETRRGGEYKNFITYTSTTAPKGYVPFCMAKVKKSLLNACKPVGTADASFKCPHAPSQQCRQCMDSDEHNVECPKGCYMVENTAPSGGGCFANLDDKDLMITFLNENPHIEKFNKKPRTTWIPEPVEEVVIKKEEVKKPTTKPVVQEKKVVEDTKNDWNLTGEDTSLTILDVSSSMYNKKIQEKNEKGKLVTVATYLDKQQEIIQKAKVKNWCYRGKTSSVSHATFNSLDNTTPNYTNLYEHFGKKTSFAGSFEPYECINELCQKDTKGVIKTVNFICDGPEESPMFGKVDDDCVEKLKKNNVKFKYTIITLKELTEKQQAKHIKFIQGKLKYLKYKDANNKKVVYDIDVDFDFKN